MRNILSNLVSPFKETRLQGLSESYPVKVQEIHHLFNTAADRLLIEAKEIVNKSEEKLSELPEFIENEEKAKRLRNMGFTNSREYCSYQQKKTEIETAKRIAIANKENNKLTIDAINYFSSQYPLYKFITIDQVNEICKKYNLVWSSIDKYKGFIPDINLKQIENFKVREQDCAYWTSRYNDFMPYPEPDARRTSLYDPFESSRDLLRAGLLGLRNTPFRYDYSERKYKMPLHIAAPIKDMDTSGMEQNGFRLTIKLEVPDPIVFQPVVYKGVKGGLIATMWGDEASDPIVQNPKMN